MYQARRAFGAVVRASNGRLAHGFKTLGLLVKAADLTHARRRRYWRQLANNWHSERWQNEFMQGLFLVLGLQLLKRSHVLQMSSWMAACCCIWFSWLEHHQQILDLQLPNPSATVRRF